MAVKVLNILSCVNFVLCYCSRACVAGSSFVLSFINCTYVQAVRNGDLKIIPSMHEKVWYNWLENCRLVTCHHI